MQFLVTALDYTDTDAPGRRQANREAHLAGATRLLAEGNILSAGAILDDDGKMIGSTLHMEFNDRSQLEAWLERDPYITGKVWEKIEIRQARFLPT